MYVIPLGICSLLEKPVAGQNNFTKLLVLSWRGAGRAGHALCHEDFPGIHAGPHLLIAGFDDSCFPCKIAQLLWHPSTEQCEWQLCSAARGALSFVGGVGTCSRLFRASIRGGKPWLLVVLTGAEHNEVVSVCKGTPWTAQAAQASQRPRGKRGGEKDKALGAAARQGHSG